MTTLTTRPESTASSPASSLCRKCGYSLRGLEAPVVCPECGGSTEDRRLSILASLRRRAWLLWPIPVVTAIFWGLHTPNVILLRVLAGLLYQLLIITVAIKLPVVITRRVIRDTVPKPRLNSGRIAVLRWTCLVVGLLLSIAFVEIFADTRVPSRLVSRLGRLAFVSTIVLVPVNLFIMSRQILRDTVSEYRLKSWPMVVFRWSASVVWLLLSLPLVGWALLVLFLIGLKHSPMP